MQNRILAILDLLVLVSKLFLLRFQAQPARTKPSPAPPWSGFPSPQSYSSPPDGRHICGSGRGYSWPFPPAQLSPSDSSPSSSPPGRSRVGQTSRTPGSSACVRSPIERRSANVREQGGNVMVHFDLLHLMIESSKQYISINNNRI